MDIVHRPTSNPFVSSSTCVCPVRNMTGISCVSAPSFKCAHTSYPSMSGIITSSRIRSGGGVSFASPNAFAPLGRDADFVEVFQDRIHDLNVGGSIIHHQHSLLLISLVHQSSAFRCTMSGDLIQFHQRGVEIEVVDRLRSDRPSAASQQRPLPRPAVCGMTLQHRRHSLRARF